MERCHAISTVALRCRSSAIIVFLFAPLLAGCGNGSDGVSVSGKVLFQNKALADGIVTFFPLKGSPISAGLDSAGAYSVSLPPGEYRVTVRPSITVPAGWKEGDPEPKQELILPAQYTQPARTVLKAVVAADQRDSIDFVLK
jgi:hypothetical protein